MICPRCGTQNPDSASKCARCGISLALGGDGETFAGIVPAPIPTGAAAAPAPALAPASPSMADMATAGPWAVSSPGATSGDEVNFGPRYKIQRMLGEGGMGAVYKAHDLELDRTVALKLIRPGLATDPNIAARFKQELLLASKASHKNILRIHDLGDAGGVKFISMAYVEGQDLHQLLVDNGKLGVERSVKLAKQMCAALDAAHSEGVVHRDFKPQNILLDKNEQVYVTDFGLAKSLEADAGLSRSGEFLGTPRYMAPEQVEGRGIDHRVDLYALGLIMYEMLTGDLPFHADSTIQLMYKRVNETPKSPKELNPELPDWIVRVVMKCLERAPDRRYQNAADILTDLSNAMAPVGSKSSPIAFTIRRIELDMPAAKLGLVIAIATVVIAGVITLAVPSMRHRIFGSRQTSSNVTHKPVVVLVADFNNHTGDPVFDGTLEPVINTALEGASFVTAFNRGEALRAAAKLPNPSKTLDDQTAKLVATNQGVGAVVSGTLERKGNGFDIVLKAIRAVTGEPITTAEVEAPNKDQVLFAATKAAAAIRKALGDTTSESDQLFAMETLTATSLEAVHAFSRGMEALTRGKYDEALQSFAQATDLDPKFGAAYGGKAIAAYNSGNMPDAIANIKQAITNIDRMTERERYRTRGMYYFLTHNDQKCVEEYSALGKLYPSDLGAHVNVATCWMNMRNFSKAMEEMQQALEIYPKRVPFQVNVALYQALSGDFAGAEKQAKTALELAPQFDKGYLILAYAQLGDGKFQEATASYRQLAKLNDVDASIAAGGLADIAMYDGRFAEAAAILQPASDTDAKAKRLDRVADKLTALAQMELYRGHADAARSAAEKALANDKSVKTRFLVGSIFAQTGVPAKARELASSLASEVQSEPQAYAKLIEGEISLHDGDTAAAIKAFTDASNLQNTWLAHFDLGRAYVEAKAYTEADSEFEICIRRRGEAILLFMDDVPTYANLPAAYYYQGRVREGLKTSNFAESYRQYLGIREKAGEDPLVADIHRRLSSTTSK
jgi:eukaryotic-like serine/threonine-protein kinase